MTTDQQKPPLSRRISRVLDPVWLRSWIHAQEADTGLKGFALRQLQVFVLTARSLRQENLTLRAAALTYHTMLSIVPLLAVAFALFKAFGGLKKLEEPLKAMMVENLAMGRAEEVGAWLDRFIQNINAGAIAGVGVLVLFYSAVGLLTNMERSLNQIWGAKRIRPFFVRFAIYWCLITLTPPLVGYSISLTAQFQSSEFGALVLQWLPFGLGRLLLSLSSTLAICIAFVLIYVVVPSAKVKLRAALAGGLVGGLIWSLSKYLFINLTAGTIKYSAIYGALGVLPLLMIWMYISWLIVLFGATYAYATQTVATESLELGSTTLAPAFREQLAGRLLVSVAGDFRRGAEPPSAETLTKRMGTLLPVARRVLDILVAQKLLVEVQNGMDARYVPGQDLQELTLARLLRALRHDHGTTFALSEASDCPRLRQALEKAEAAVEELLAGETFFALAEPRAGEDQGAEENTGAEQGETEEQAAEEAARSPG